MFSNSDFVRPQNAPATSAIRLKSKRIPALQSTYARTRLFHAFALQLLRAESGFGMRTITRNDALRQWSRRRPTTEKLSRFDRSRFSSIGVGVGKRMIIDDGRYFHEHSLKLLNTEETVTKSFWKGAFDYSHETLFYRISPRSLHTIERSASSSRSSGSRQELNRLASRSAHAEMRVDTMVLEDKKSREAAWVRYDDRVYFVEGEMRSLREPSSRPNNPYLSRN